MPTDDDSHARLLFEQIADHMDDEDATIWTLRLLEHRSFAAIGLEIGRDRGWGWRRFHGMVSEILALLIEADTKVRHATEPLRPIDLAAERRKRRVHQTA